MFKSIMEKANNVVKAAADKSVELVGSSIQTVGKVVEVAPSKVDIYSKSAKLCYKIGQLEGAQQSNINRGVSKQMEDKINQLNELIKAERNTVV